MTVIMKFGGAAVTTPDRIIETARLIAKRLGLSERIVVVVSAMGGATDQLIELANQIHPNPPQREYDMLVSVGERVSMSLLAMALEREGVSAVSFTGSQAGIITTTDHTDARIIDVRPHRVQRALDSGKVAIVAGFQGVSSLGEVTTLGRGGSDTTAVALGIALDGSVEFYKDVEGIYSEDPKKNPAASRLKDLSYDHALDIVRRGAKVLHPRCIELAQQNQIALLVRSFTNCIFNENEGTTIGGKRPISTRQKQYES